MLLALGAAAFFFLKMRRYLPERSRAAELAPAETILLVQLPNLRQTALRIPKTDLYQIWREPEVQAFMEKPRRKAPWMSEWEKRFEEIARVAPGEVFVAFTSFDGPRPGFVGGFSFAGSSRQAEALAGHLREPLFPGGELASAVRSNWYFFATDADLLARAIERFEGKPGPALAADPIFQKTIAPLGAGHDLVLYGKPDALSGRLDVLAGLGGKTAPGPQAPLAMATKIDGGKLHDTIFLPGNSEPTPTALSRQTLLLASPQTLLYYVTDLGSLSPVAGSGMALALLPGLAGMEQSLAEKGLSWKDLPQAFGPELGAMIEWPEDAALPTLLLASEIRDPAKARTFADLLAAAPTADSSGKPGEPSGVILLKTPLSGLSFVRPALALADRFALLGLSPETVTGALPRTLPGATTLGQVPTFQEVAPLIPAGASAFGYLDFPRLFERVYRMTRPFITLSLAFSVEAGAQWDAGKLPPVEAISKHLSASVIAQSRSEHGVLIESIGSLTLPELLFGVSASTLASGLPDLSGVLPTGLKAPATPKPTTAPTPPVGPADGGAEVNAPPLSPEKLAPKHK